MPTFSVLQSLDRNFYIGCTIVLLLAFLCYFVHSPKEVSHYDLIRFGNFDCRFEDHLSCGYFKIFCYLLSTNSNLLGQSESEDLVNSFQVRIPGSLYHWCNRLDNNTSTTFHGKCRFNIHSVQLVQ